MDKYQTDKIHVNSLRKDAMAAYKEWKAHSASAEHIKAVYLKEYTDAWQAYQQADMAQFLYEAENE